MNFAMIPTLYLSSFSNFHAENATKDSVGNKAFRPKNIGERQTKKGGQEAPFQSCDAPFVLAGSTVCHTHGSWRTAPRLYPAHRFRRKSLSIFDPHY